MADFILTSEGCSVDGASCPGVPLVRRKSQRVWWEPTDFFIAVSRGGLATTTLRTYASYICDLLSQMEVDHVDFSGLSNAYMRAYRSSLRARGVSKGYISDMIRIQLHLLFLIQDRGALTNLIGPSCTFAVEASRENGIIHSDLIPPAAGRATSVRNLPSRESIEIVKAHAQFRAAPLAERLELMMDWQLVNLRAAEVCALIVEQIPTIEVIDELLKKNRSLEIHLTRTKGNKPRVVPVHPLLLQRTRNWIDNDRRLILRETRGRRRPVKRGIGSEPREIFLSSKTGLAIGPKTLSNQIRAAFKGAQRAGELTSLDRVWSHGLRHHAISNELKSRLAAGQRMAPVIVAKRSGHGSVAAMQPYVHLAESEDIEPTPPGKNRARRR